MSKTQELAKFARLYKEVCESNDIIGFDHMRLAVHCDENSFAEIAKGKELEIKDIGDGFTKYSFVEEDVQFFTLERE